MQATNYHKGSQIQQEVGKRMINMLDIKKGGTVLDLGCGTGYLTKVLSERVGLQGKVVAVDPDGERLKIAKEKHLADNIEYVQADDKTFPQGQYDLVFSNIVIHWISDKKAALKKVHENLRPGGHFAFTTANGIYPIPDIGRRLFNELVGPNFIDCMLKERMIFWNESQYNSLAIEVGFRQISMTLLPDYPTWKNLDDYINSMYGWFKGEFDPAEFNQETFQEIKREYGTGPVIQSEPIYTLYAIYIK